MLRPGLKWVIFTALILLSITVITAAFAQPDITAEETAPPADTELTGNETIEDPYGIELPEDITTHEDFQPEDDAQPQFTLGWWDYVKTFISLAIVLVFIWGISVLFKKFITVRGLATTSESLKILYTLSLTPTRTLYLVRLGDRILLIGSGDGGMRTLSEITDPEEVSAIIREIEYKGNFDLNPFRDRLQTLIGEDEGPGVSKEDFRDHQRRLKGAMDRLKNHDDIKPD